jgi:hypothetical protein
MHQPMPKEVPEAFGHALLLDVRAVCSDRTVYLGVQVIFVRSSRVGRSARSVSRTRACGLWSCGTTPCSNQGRLRLPPEAAGRRHAKIAATPMNQSREAHHPARPLTPPRGTLVAFRVRTSERGGRSSWRLSGTLRQPPSSESHRRRPLLIPPRSHYPYPVVSETNLTAGVR